MLGWEGTRNGKGKIIDCINVQEGGAGDRDRLQPHSLRAGCQHLRQCGEELGGGGGGQRHTTAGM